MTVKGKGFTPAEKDQAVWHAPGRFDPATGERLGSNAPAAKYQEGLRPDARGARPARSARGGRDACDAVGQLDESAAPGLPCPTAASTWASPRGHAVTFSAGLAAAGMRPFCNIYSSFMQRAYDNLIHDVAIQNLPVVMCLDRGGLVGEDGVTHHGVFDMAAFGSVPNLRSPRRWTRASCAT